MLFSRLDSFRLGRIKMPFQVWGYVCLLRHYGCQIILYVHTPNKEFDDFPMKFEDVSEIPTINRAEWIDYLEKRAAEGYEIKYSTNCDNEPEIIIAVKNIGQPVFAE